MTAMDERRIELPPRYRLRVQSRSGKVHVVSEDRPDVAVETDRVESYYDDEHDMLVVRSKRGGHASLNVRCPAGADVTVGTHSGDVRLDGAFGAVNVTTMSASIAVDRAEEADLRSMSGQISINACEGRCRLNALSGRVTGGDLDSAYAQTVSGSIRLDRVLGDVRARTVNGQIEVNASGDSVIAVKTVSGRVRITLPPGTEPRTVFKTRGQVRCDFPQGDDCRIECASLSGTIEVLPAAGGVAGPS
jgi:DUF4097 and DUF4098 domain-containing protein YvlB